MITTATQAQPTSRTPSWHAGFLELMPSIEAHAATAFGYLDVEAKREAVAETVAAALVAYKRLFERGRENVAHPSTMSRFAVCHVRNGRHVGGRENNRDVLSESAGRRKGFSVDRLDHFEKEDHAWQEIVIEDRRSSPADIAATRLDVTAWFDQLPAHKRKMAKALATGERTGEVARKFGVSAGRVSQLRTELRDSWATFQGELPAAAKTAARIT